MHIDGKIDEQTYHFKLEEYKQEQQALILEIKSYDNDNEAELIAAREVLDLAKNAKEIFMSSEVDEKRQLITLVLQNVRLDEKKIVWDANKPFNIILDANSRKLWRG